MRGVYVDLRWHSGTRTVKMLGVPRVGDRVALSGLPVLTVERVTWFQGDDEGPIVDLGPAR